MAALGNAPENQGKYSEIPPSRLDLQRLSRQALSRLWGNASISIQQVGVSVGTAALENTLAQSHTIPAISLLDLHHSYEQKCL